MDRKHEILATLKRRGPSSLGEIAGALSLTKQGAQRHLEQLHQQGLVELESVKPSGPGRPQHRYRLTEAAQHEFPGGHQELAAQLVEFLPPAELEAFFAARAARQEEVYRAEITGATIDERAGELAHATQRSGHMTDLQHAPDGTLLLQHHNCPIQDVAAKTGYPCQREREMYARLLGAEVTRQTWLGSGDITCGYRLVLLEKESATRMADFEIKDLRVAVEGREILKGVSLSINKGEVHAVMGPNGSGKSTLAAALMGHPSYQVLGGEVLFKGINLLELSVDQRARLGIFLALQYPTVVPGVTHGQLPAHRHQRQARRTTGRTSRRQALTPREFRSLLGDSEVAAHGLLVPAPAISTRGSAAARRSAPKSCRWRCCKPEIAILDETDSGLDIDSIKFVSEAVNRMRGPDLGVLIITHYTRILEFIKPDFVHVLVGRPQFVRLGGPEVADRARDDRLFGMGATSPCRPSQEVD